MPMFGITPTVVGITAAATGSPILGKIAKFTSFAGPAAMAAGSVTSKIAGGAERGGAEGAMEGTASAIQQGAATYAGGGLGAVAGGAGATGEIINSDLGSGGQQGPSQPIMGMPMSKNPMNNNDFISGHTVPMGAGRFV